MKAPTLAPSPSSSADAAPAGNLRDRRWLAVWIVITVLGLAYGIGGYGLIEPDEGRNAEVAREMAATNNYILPHLNGLPYLDGNRRWVAFGPDCARVTENPPGETEVE